MQILVDGVIAPWLWNGNSYFQGPLIDPGIFAPAGTSLTGDAIHITWDTDPSITAAITIDGVTVTLGPTSAYAVMNTGYQNITVTPGLAVNSYDPTYAALHNPNGIGGALDLIGLHGYFFTTSMSGLNSPTIVPGPIMGTGLPALLVIVLVVCAWFQASRPRGWSAAQSAPSKGR